MPLETVSGTRGRSPKVRAVARQCNWHCRAVEMGSVQTGAWGLYEQEHGAHCRAVETGVVHTGAWGAARTGAWGRRTHGGQQVK